MRAHRNGRGAGQAAVVPPIVGPVDLPAFRVTGIPRRSGCHGPDRFRLEDIWRRGKSVNVHVGRQFPMLAHPLARVDGETL